MTEHSPETEEVSEKSPTTLTSMFSNAIGLGIFAVVTAGVIAVTQFSTKDKIVFNQKLFQAKQLVELVPGALEELSEPFGVISVGDEKWQKLDLLSQSSEFEYFYSPTKDAVILPAIAPQGYTEAINLLVAINGDGSLAGVRVTAHKETPGLGDGIETRKSDWIYQFDGKSLFNPEPESWLVKKDGGEFDQMTGATITPRAIVKAVKNTLEFYNLNAEALKAGQ